MTIATVGIKKESLNVLLSRNYKDKFMARVSLGLRARALFKR